MDKVSSLAYQLHEMLLQSNEYLSLKETENIMLNDSQDCWQNHNREYNGFCF